MARRRKGLAIDGVFLLDKPQGISSNTALQKVRRLFNAQKAGHTGTLDPMATGLLPVCLGEATKFSGYLLESDKTYRTRVKLGEITDTGDAEGEVIKRTALPESLDQALIEKTLALFHGEMAQVPPMYSALKHNGRKLYELARQGKTIERASRQINLYDVRLLSMERDGFWLQVHCSKGTYIRTLAEDIGEALGFGAHITVLERLQTSTFQSDQCITIEALEAMSQDERLAALKPSDIMLKHLPTVNVDQANAEKLMLGQKIAFPTDVDPQSLEGSPIRVYYGQHFLGLVERTEHGGLGPKRLVNTSAWASTDCSNDNESA